MSPQKFALTMSATTGVLPTVTLVFTHEYEGYRFPADKDKVLERIEQGLTFGEKPKRFINF
jgi:hypothetical protein